MSSIWTLIYATFEDATYLFAKILTKQVAYYSKDLEGPFLMWLLKHLRLQQKEGKGLDLHLHLGEKVSLHQVNQTFVHFDVLDDQKHVFSSVEV